MSKTVPAIAPNSDPCRVSSLQEVGGVSGLLAKSAFQSSADAVQAIPASLASCLTRRRQEAEAPSSQGCAPQTPPRPMRQKMADARNAKSVHGMRCLGQLQVGSSDFGLS